MLHTRCTHVPLHTLYCGAHVSIDCLANVEKMSSPERKGRIGVACTFMFSTNVAHARYRWAPVACPQMLHRAASRWHANVALSASRWHANVALSAIVACSQMLHWALVADVKMCWALVAGMQLLHWAVIACLQMPITRATKAVLIKLLINVNKMLIKC